MQVNHTPSPSLTQENRFPWYLSLALFTLVACGSIGIGIYSYILDQDMLSNRVSIADVEKKIQMMSTDKDIIITRILQSNTIRPSLDINGLIKEFQRVAVASNVRLSGFNVSNDTITTALTATEGDPQVHPDPASTIIKMIREYAKGQQYFALDPINTISGDIKQRSTAITFKVVGKKY